MKELHVRITAFLLAILMSLSFLGVTTFASGNERSINIKISYQDNEFILARQEFEISPGLAKDYGYIYGSGITENDVTALDALVMAHISVLGVNEEEIHDYLEILENGYVSTSMGDDSGNTSYFINGEIGVDFFNSAILNDNDIIQFVVFQDTVFYSDAYCWFENDGQKTESISVNKGEKFSLTVWRADYVVYGEYGALPPTEACDAAVVLVEVDGVGLFSEPLAITEEDGVFTWSFDEAGQYILSAYNYEPEYWMPLISPWMVVNVSENIPPTITPTAAPTDIPTITPTATPTITPTPLSNWESSLSNVLSKIKSDTENPTISSVGGEWAVLALARAGIKDSDWYNIYLNNLRRLTSLGIVKINESRPTENERVILALTSMGINAANFEGRDFVSVLNNDSYISAQGINSQIFALIALDSGNYLPGETTLRNNLLASILSRQLSDGGFNIVGHGNADPDVTAMVISALAPYYSRSVVKTALDSAKETLIKLNLTTSQNISQKIVALSAIGEDPTEYVNKLLLYQTDDGGFRYSASGSANQMATEQAAYALVAYARYIADLNSLYDMSDALSEQEPIIPINPPSVTPVTPKPPSTTRNAYISVVNSGATGSQKNIYFSKKSFKISDNETAFSILQKTGLTIVINNSNSTAGTYVVSIDGFGEFSDGSNSGWLYKVNGVFPNYSASEYELSDGDNIEWVYTRNLGSDVGLSIYDVTNRPTTQETNSNSVSEITLTPTPTSISTSSIDISSDLDDNLDNNSNESYSIATNSFIDVKANDWFFEAVQFVYSQELMVGVSTDEFAPNIGLTRAMFITILARMAKADSIGGATWYEKSVAWGISNGLTDGEFLHSSITREQLVSMLYRYDGSPEVIADFSNFKDGEIISDYAVSAMSWAVENGIILGRSTDIIAPKEIATRAEAAEILKRYIYLRG